LFWEILVKILYVCMRREKWRGDRKREGWKRERDEKEEVIILHLQFA
jgi:hypothetical protein